jgi:hypothetical protein
MRSNTTASASWRGGMATACSSTPAMDMISLPRFPQIVKAVSKLKTRSCFIDGEAIVVDERGLSTFDLFVPGDTTMLPCSAPSI